MNSPNRVHGNSINGPWNPTRVAELTRLVELGWSSGQIAANFGMTRNAIIGKVARLKLQLKGGDGSAPQVRKVRDKVVRLPKPGRPPKRQAKIIPLPEGPHMARTFADLKPHQCKWGLDDPGPGRMDAMLCCAAPAPEHSFCAHHHAAAYQRPKPVASTVRRAA